MYKNNCICFDNVMWLMTMKMRLKIKSKSQRYDINWPKPRHGHKYTKYKACLSMMVVFSKQHLSNIWSWIHEKVKQHWGWVEKSLAYTKKRARCCGFKFCCSHLSKIIFTYTFCLFCCCCCCCCYSLRFKSWKNGWIILWYSFTFWRDLFFDALKIHSLLTQPAFTCSKSTIKTPGQCVKSVHS